MSAPGGVSAPGWGVSSAGGRSAPRGASQHALRQTPPSLTESQTPVKTLPCPNFVAGGNNKKIPTHLIDNEYVWYFSSKFLVV